MTMKGILWTLCRAGVVCVLLTLAGCGFVFDKATSGPADQVVYRGFRGPPRIRYGTYPTSTLGTPFLGSDLGSHAYHWSPFEKNGIVYTCRAGHIDIIHLRIAADWTAYLTAKAYHHLVRADTSFSFKLAVDRSRSYVQISYPDNWDRLPTEPRTAIARQVASAMGPYLAYTMVTWHEILTWYGFKCVGLPVEYDSAFSWEDSFSNLLGTIVASRALRDTRHSYNTAVEIVLDGEMRKLGIQPADTARRASHSVKGEWFTGDVALLVDMKKRNFDIGLDDGLVTATLVPDVPGCAEVEPVSYPVPRLDMLAKHGFSVTIEIEPHEWEKDRILRIVHKDRDKHHKRIDPEIHFAQIMDHMRRQAAQRYGPEYSPDRDDDEQYVLSAE